jgi:phenylalanyl-tRNA synthetase alpha chain
MDQLLQQIENYKQEIASIVPNGAESLEAYRIKFLGTKGIMKNLFSEMKNVPNEKKKEFGQILNDFKQFAESKYEEWKLSTTNDQQPTTNDIDLTLPGDALPLGTRHPISLVRNEIIHIFGRLGFSVAEGPEIEDDWHNFTALNLPENHPARDMQDTFYIHQNPDWLLRTHTSSVQARTM